MFTWSWEYKFVFYLYSNLACVNFTPSPLTPAEREFLDSNRYETSLVPSSFGPDVEPNIPAPIETRTEDVVVNRIVPVPAVYRTKNAMVMWNDVYRTKNAMVMLNLSASVKNRTRAWWWRETCLPLSKFDSRYGDVIVFECVMQIRAEDNSTQVNEVWPHDGD